MTREEILNMQAGEELDEKIALQIFGETYSRGYHVPNYSTDIAAAWEVAQRIMEINNGLVSDQLFFEIYRYTAKGIFSVSFFKKPKKKLFSIAYADTAPLAICRAALLAVNEE